MGRVGGVAPADRVADVDGHALAAMEDLDGRRGQPPIDRLVHERIGHGVVVPAQFDVIVDVDPGVDGQLAVDEGLGGERAEGGQVELGEQRAPAGAVQAHRAGIELHE